MTKPTHDKTPDQATLEQARAQGFREGVEAAAAIVENNSEAVSLVKNTRLLIPRSEGDSHATAYAAAIRALLPADAPDELAALRAEIERLLEALKDSEIKFEAIRRLLINELKEPERSAFWNAVTGRDFIRAALAQKEG